MVGVTSRNPQFQKPEPLTREEEYDLILRVKSGDQRAMNCLIRRNQGLIRKTVKRYGNQVDWSPLTAAGQMAVVLAARGFDLSTGNRFSTYLVPTIWSEVRDCFCRETGISRITLDNLKKVSKASAALSQELDRDPTLGEIAERSELSQQQILTAWEKKAFAQALSFNQKFDDDCPEWLDSQVDETVDLWRTSEDAEILDTLDQLKSCGHLKDRQVTMLIAKHQGFNNKEIGRQLGISRERVRQLFNSAKEKVTALTEGNLKLTPIKTVAPVPTHQNIEPIGQGDPLSFDLPVPKVAKKPALKRVDASRLGGRIGTAIKQIFNQTKECSNDQLEGLTHAQKHILAFSRRSSHRTADRSGYQSTSADQRCCRLEQARDAWQGRLGISQVIQQPLASAYQRIRGFGSKLTQWRGNTQFYLAKVFEDLEIGHGNSPPRPPTDRKDGFSLETNYFPFRGIKMRLAKYLALACIFIFGTAIIQPT